MQEASDLQKTDIGVPIIGSDRDLNVIRQAFANAESSGLEDWVKFSRQELSKIQAPADRGVLICNPPYGVRLGKEAELGELYRLLGDIFKQRFKGWTAYILTGSTKLSKQVGELPNGSNSTMVQFPVLYWNMKYISDRLTVNNEQWTGNSEQWAVTTNYCTGGSRIAPNY